VAEIEASQFDVLELTWQPPAGYGVTAVLTAPDGSTQQLTASSASALPNVWTVWCMVDLVGTWTLTWTGVGTQATSTDTITVTEKTLAEVMSLDDCYQSLNMPSSAQGANAGRDADMLTYASAATSVVEGIVGPVRKRTLWQVFDGGELSIRLKWKPTAILRIVENGVDIFDWVPDLDSGIIHAGTTWWNRPFWPGVQNVQVFYQAGDGNPVPNVSLAIREEFRFLWQVGRQGGNFAPQEQADGSYTVQGFAVPNRVQELLQTVPRMPGFA
jgi:hypothetical protein